MITVGRHTDVDEEAFKLYGVDVTIGNFSSVGGRTVTSGPPQHHMKYVSSYALTGRSGGYRGGITIGSDVWIGQDSVLIGGAYIADGAVVGQRSVCAGYVPHYAIAAGNPCRIVGWRFSPEQIDALLQIRWWDWPEEKIEENAEILCSDDIDGFIERFR